MRLPLTRWQHRVVADFEGRPSVWRGRRRFDVERARSLARSDDDGRRREAATAALLLNPHHQQCCCCCMPLTTWSNSAHQAQLQRTISSQQRAVRGVAAATLLTQTMMPTSTETGSVQAICDHTIVCDKRWLSAVTMSNGGIKTKSGSRDVIAAECVTQSRAPTGCGQNGVVKSPLPTTTTQGNKNVAVGRRRPTLSLTPLSAVHVTQNDVTPTDSGPTVGCFSCIGRRQVNSKTRHKAPPGKTR